MHDLSIIVEPGGGRDVGRRPVRLEGRLTGLTVADVLRRLTEQAGATYEVRPDCVIVRPK